MVIFAGDCASDPPLGATLRALACARAEDVLLGLAALAPPKCKLQLTVRHPDAEAALAEAARRLAAAVEIVRLPDAWPPAANELPDARALVAASPLGKEARRFVTVAGAVKEPAVMPVRGEATLAELLAAAGGPVDDDWLPLVFGEGFELREREAAWAGEPLVLALPAAHPLARNRKTPLTDWLKRAASACEGCSICSESCAHLRPHEIVWTLATARDDGTRLTEALACTGCGLCDAMCPAALSPRALVVDARNRLRAAGASVSPSLRKLTGLDVKLLTQRLGLADYDREPLRKF
jgi:ferredoxin